MSMIDGLSVVDAMTIWKTRWLDYMIMIIIDNKNNKKNGGWVGDNSVDHQKATDPQAKVDQAPGGPRWGGTLEIWELIVN